MSEQPEGGEGYVPSTATIAGSLETFSDLMQQLTSAADVTAAFGDPHTVGERTVISVAEVMCGFGLGMGTGGGVGPGTAQTGGGGGAGGGGATRARPVAVVVVEPDRVTVRPVVDVTQLGLALLSAGIFGLWWWCRTMRRIRKAEGR